MSNLVTSEQLRQYVERIERLEEEKVDISSDIKLVYAEAKGNGFDAPTIREIIKYRKLSEDQRNEKEALFDIYRAALGMLHDTPLGAAAIKRLTNKPKPEEKLEEPDQTEPEKQVIGEKEIQEARERGIADAKAGKPVTSNPYPANDPRRAVWDEEWCRTSGSDGFDVPDAWKPSKKPKKKDEEDKKDQQ